VRSWLAPVVVTCSCLLASCTSSAGAGQDPVESRSPTSPSARSSEQGVVTEDYLPGLAAQLRAPAGEGPAPLVVLVPGGGWATADPTGLVPLAEALTAQGSSTSLITYSTTSGGSRFPTTVDDVACAIRWSAQQAQASGHPPSRTIVLGHSAGGHLAALVAFSGDEFGGACPYQSVPIDGLIGIAGIYDTDEFAPVLSPWMPDSPSGDPVAWQLVNPVHWLEVSADELSDLQVLLLHGDADTIVPISQTTALEGELNAAEVEVTKTVLPGLGHLDVFEADHVEAPITDWLTTWQ